MYFTDVFSSGIWRGLREIRDPELKALADKLPPMALCSRQDKTVKNYLAAFQKWKEWCNNYKEISHLPAEPHYIALYLLNLSHTCNSHAPVSLAFYSISWAHRSAGLTDPTKGDLPKMVREAAVRTLGQGNNKKEPISAQTLCKIINKYAHTNADLMDLRIAAICILSFTAFLRYDELSKIKYCDILFGSNYLKIFLETSKTDVHRIGEWVYVAKLSSNNCPVKIVKRYLLKAGFDSYSENYIFRGITRNKVKQNRKLKRSNKPISYSTVRSLLLQVFKSVGKDPKILGTHSLRKGGATAAARNSVEDRLFKKHGRWRSENSKDKYVKESIEQKLFVSRNLGL